MGVFVFINIVMVLSDTLGGISCVVGTSKEAILYFLPTNLNSYVTRVVSYHFTAPLISFAFDSLSLHALTESGLETYTFRGLWHAIKDKEGISKFHNVSFVSSRQY